MRAVRGLLLMLTIVSVALGLSVVGAGYQAAHPPSLKSWPLLSAAADTVFRPLARIAGRSDADRAMVAVNPRAHPMPVSTWQIGPSRSPQEDGRTHPSPAHTTHSSDTAVEPNDLRGFLYDMARATRFHNSIGITGEKPVGDRRDHSAGVDK